MNADSTRSGNAAQHIINLGLQGGGAHGAYSWGVLDALLEDDRFDFEGISGTSAGAMNAVVLANGLMVGGKTGARKALEAFWLGVASAVPMDLSVPVGNDGVGLHPATKLLFNWTEYFSPYQLNPLNINPLHDILNVQIDFAGLRKHSPVRLFIAATHVTTGKLRLFRNPEITAETVLASACLPMVHQAIEIDGEPYWDGGYSANPAVFPLINECAARDILLVLLAPQSYGPPPRSMDEIRERIMEFSFNTGLLREMLLIAHLFSRSQGHDHSGAGSNKGWRRGPLRFLGRPKNKLSGLERQMLDTRFHLIEAEGLWHRFGSESKMIATRSFLQTLRDIGYTNTQEWLKQHGDQVGKEPSVDVVARFGS
jgi:NTE family protein